MPSAGLTALIVTPSGPVRDVVEMYAFGPFLMYSFVFDGVSDGDDDCAPCVGDGALSSSGGLSSGSASAPGGADGASESSFRFFDTPPFRRRLKVNVRVKSESLPSELCSDSDDPSYTYGDFSAPSGRDDGPATDCPPSAGRPPP